MKNKVLKKITNEDLLKQIKELQKKVEESKHIVPYIPAPIVVSSPCHHHCHCLQCNPIQPIHVVPFTNPCYTVTNFGGVVGNIQSTLGNGQVGQSTTSIFTATGGGGINAIC